MPPPAPSAGASGAISGYHAHLEPDSLGLTFEALVFVTMRGADRATIDAFEQAVAAVPQSGRPNGSSVTPTTCSESSPPTCPPSSSSTTPQLATLPGVQRLSSTLVMKSVVENRALPL